MGWSKAQEGRSRAYVHNHQVNGRRALTRVGTGLVGEIAWKQDEARRLEREAATRNCSAVQTRCSEVSRAAHPFYMTCDLVARATRIVAGYHFHRGE